MPVISGSCKKKKLKLFLDLQKHKTDIVAKKIYTSFTYQKHILLESYYVVLPTTTTKPYPTKWGWLHESNDTIVFYQKPCLSPTH